MLKKSYSKTGSSCRVTFALPAEVEAGSAALCGDFNDWDSTASPMTQRKDGRFSVTVSLKPGSDYRFKYLVDGERWENDWDADAYMPNEHGGEDSVVKV
ncbi:MAG: isoamylase early set domain-containing protein [Chloroflexota bacterium]|nr:isoamylase early set domain-containing protein [Chloroflexota bacterium]